MKNKKVLVVFIISILIICSCTNVFAAVTPSSYMNYKKAEAGMRITAIWLALLVIGFVIVMILFKKDKIKKKIFNILIIIISIQVVIGTSAFFISKTIYNKNYQSYQNYLDLKRGLNFNWK